MKLEKYLNEMQGIPPGQDPKKQINYIIKLAKEALKKLAKKDYSECYYTLENIELVCEQTKQTVHIDMEIQK